MIKVFSGKSTSFTNNGLRVLSECISCTITEELNGLYELLLEYPIDSLGKWECLVDDNIISVDGQLFRIYNKSKNMASIKVFARHIFYDLLDNFLEDVRPTNTSGAGALSDILTHTQYAHPFISMSDVATLSTRYFIRKNPVEAILGDDGITTRWGGELVRDNFTIKLLNARGLDRGVLIAYGKNIKGLTETLDNDGLCTRLMPIGKEGLLLTEKYIDSPHISNYLYPKIKTQDFNDAEDEVTLRALGNAYMVSNQIDIPIFNYTVDFEELSKTEEYKNYKVLELVHMGDIVTIKHNRLKINLKAKVIKMTWNVLTGRIDKVELGSFKPNSASRQNANIQETKKELEKVKSDYQIAIDKATEEITGAKGGNVVIRLDENGKPYEILIMDTNDVLTATKVWRWNLGGLGYSSTGVNGPYGLAMTQDGEIVADFITSGVMNAARITAGILSAITIQNQDGSFKIDLSGTGGASYYTNGKLAMKMVSNKIDFFNHGKNGDYIGSIGSINEQNAEYPLGDPDKPSIGIWNDIDSNISIGYKRTGMSNKSYIEFDKYQVSGVSASAIRVGEGVDFLDIVKHYTEVQMRNYPIYLSDESDVYIRNTLINSVAPAAKIGPILWVDTDIYASGIKLNGADYAEFFEWLDGNSEDEDRVGYIVSLEGEKIIKANGDDILGIISATPSIVGDTSHDGWNSKYLTDKWGRNIYETIDATYDIEGNIITPAHIGREKRLNPYYDETLEYIPRSARKEWDKVGLIGKLICRDDGLANIGDYVSAINGVGSKSDAKTKLKMMKRIDANTIKVFVM